MKKLSSWETKEYYLKAKKGSSDISHFGIKVLKKYVNKEFVNKVLDIGCGEGTRLSYLINESNGIKKGFGIDISKTAILLAKKNYPYLEFIKSDIEKIPFKNNSFDFIYSAYVLEHVSNPEKLISESRRLLKKNATLILIAPNYGSPNRSSPCFTRSRSKKIIEGYLDDLFRLFTRKNTLNWNKVKPIASKRKYKIDWDCQTEPYLGSLISYLKKSGFKILEYSSCWEEESKDSSLLQKVVFSLSKLKLYPFIYWGPHLVLVARKID